MLNYKKLAQETSETRSLIDESTADLDLQEQLKIIKASLKNIREILFFKGMLTGDAFYDIAEETRFTDEETSLLPRVRWDVKNDYPRFYWERIKRHAYPINSNTKIHSSNGKGRSYIAKVRRKKTGVVEKMKIVLTSEHIPLNAKTLRVHEKHFQSEPDWAQLSGGIAEDQFCQLRKLNKTISQINRNLAYLEHLLPSHQ